MSKYLKLSNPRFSNYAQELILAKYSEDFLAEHGMHPMAGGASFSDYLENKVLDHIFNDGTYSVPTASLGLWTSALTDASSGATAGEADYTTYARVTIDAADMSAAASGSKTNTAAFTFPACTAGGDTITYWGTFDSATIGAGNLLVWGTATSTVISTTQTPPTVAIGGLVVTLD